MKRVKIIIGIVILIFIIIITSIIFVKLNGLSSVEKDVIGVINHVYQDLEEKELTDIGKIKIIQVKKIDNKRIDDLFGIEEASGKIYMVKYKYSFTKPDTLSYVVQYNYNKEDKSFSTNEYYPYVECQNEEIAVYKNGVLICNTDTEPSDYQGKYWERYNKIALRIGHYEDERNNLKNTVNKMWEDDIFTNDNIRIERILKKITK